MSGYMVYVYTQKKNKEIQENKYGLKYPLITSLTVFLLYNMFILEEGVTLIIIIIIIYYFFFYYFQVFLGPPVIEQEKFV